MNTNITMKQMLAVWIAGVKALAKEDTKEHILWFVPTMNKPYSIVAGWKKMFPENNFSDLFCCSKLYPDHVMCIKIVENDGTPKLMDFETATTPTDKHGEVDDTCICLEWDDSADAAADFFIMEWGRIMKEHGEEI